jgi:hypothetical protein
VFAALLIGLLALRLDVGGPQRLAMAGRARSRVSLSERESTIVLTM